MVEVCELTTRLEGAEEARRRSDKQLVDAKREINTQYCLTISYNTYNVQQSGTVRGGGNSCCRGATDSIGIGEMWQ